MQVSLYFFFRPSKLVLFLGSTEGNFLSGEDDDEEGEVGRAGCDSVVGDD
jgi:hypothetical protein